MLKNFAIGAALIAIAGSGWAAYETQATCSKWQAYEAAKAVLKSGLKAPDSAEFPLFFSVDIRADDSLGTVCQHEIKGHFNGQNGFGAMIRHDYTVKTSANEFTPPTAFIMSLKSR